MKISPDNNLRKLILDKLAENYDIVIKGYSALEILSKKDNLNLYRGTVDIDTASNTHEFD